MNIRTRSSEYHYTKNQLLDEQLEIDQAKKNLKKFEILYDRYYERVFRFIYQRVQTESQASDLTSDTFTRAMENLTSYQFKGVPFASWLYRIARNLVYKEYKKNNSIRQVNYFSQDILDIAEEVDDGNEALKKRDLLIASIKKLNNSDTELIEMKYFEKRSYREIASIIDTTENNAKIKTYRVVQKLKSIINS